MSVITPVPPKFSHLTQQLLNYFPDTDPRVRENPVSISGQLLNAVAFQMENQQRRINRELRALNLSDVPMNIDNEGVYYATRVPTSFILPVTSEGIVSPPKTIQGQIQAGPLVTLVPYDDTLPVPTRFSQDPLLAVVPLTTPKVIDTTGDGNPQSFSLGALALPNALTFRVTGMGPQTSAITVSITGELDPPAVWPQDVHIKNEVLVLSDDGFFQTDSVWSSVNDISITGLPVSCRIECFVLPVGVEVEPDADRPFVHFAYRGVAFPRYWQLHDLLLLELYQRNRFSGPETFQTYHLPTQMVDIAIEPNTGGIFLTDGVSLFYADRRTPMPEHLEETGVTQEPAFGINVFYDYTRPGDTKYATIQPIPGPSASQVTQYRYVVEDPHGNVFVLQPTGILSQYQGNTGWTSGIPTSVSFPLTITGTYIISLEMLGSFNAKTVDTLPYGNFSLTPLAKISLATLVPSIQGIAFDAYDQLWIWTGSFAVPVKIHYDAFVWVPETRTIYATDKYVELHISSDPPTPFGEWDFSDPDTSISSIIGV